VASGEVATVASRELAELPRGFVVTSSGRISGVTEPGEVSVTYPFPVKDLVVLDDALKYEFQREGVKFIISLREDFLAQLDTWRVRMPSSLHQTSSGADLEVQAQVGLSCRF